MAFKILRPTCFGADASYWRIGAIKVFIRGRQAEVTMEGFTSMDAARDGATPMAKTTIYMPYDAVENFPEYDTLRAQLYTNFKLLEEWAASEDV